MLRQRGVIIGRNNHALEENLMRRLILLFVVVLVVTSTAAFAQHTIQYVYKPGQLKPLDSVLKVKVGELAPDFILPATNGDKVRLSDFRGTKNVMLSFVPAAFTPVCSDQWPGYDLIKDLFVSHNTIVMGISTDNVPSLYAWTEAMGGLWFPVLSDFWPHGATALKYGVLRSNGITERAIFIVDRQGIIRYIDVHDINFRPKLEPIMKALENLQ